MVGDPQKTRDLSLAYGFSLLLDSTASKTKKALPKGWIVKKKGHTDPYSGFKGFIPLQDKEYLQTEMHKKTPPDERRSFHFCCGLDETRTRDPLRDRQVF